MKSSVAKAANKRTWGLRKALLNARARKRKREKARAIKFRLGLSQALARRETCSPWRIHCRNCLIESTNIVLH